MLSFVLSALFSNCSTKSVTFESTWQVCKISDLWPQSFYSNEGNEGAEESKGRTGKTGRCQSHELFEGESGV